MATRFAASLALIAFAAVCLQGFIDGVATDGVVFAPVIRRALAAMLLFGVVGAVIGVLARNAVNESVQREIQALEAADDAASAGQAEAGPESGSDAEAWPPAAERAGDPEPPKAKGADE